MNRTKIEYLTHTWNPIAMRCTPVGPGCENCWHIRMAKRLAHNPQLLPEIRRAYAGLRGPVLVGARLQKLYHSRAKDAVIGVQFMGDLFHDSVPEEMIRTVWRVMECFWWHTFLVLTKRPHRAADVLPGFETFTKASEWPPPNIWLGTSIEDQETADQRLPALFRSPAAKRFVSIEPMLEAIDISWHLQRVYCPRCGGVNWRRSCSRLIIGPTCEQCGWDNSSSMFVKKRLDWVIVSGESGPGARPMHPDWARDVRDQCQEAGVPFFFKQMSKRAPIPDDLLVRELPYAKG